MRSDVLVVGAGPAGTAAAIHLNRAGIDTLVVDRAHFPRDKTCGDGLTTLALRELEDLGLDPATVASWTPVHEAVLVAPSGREHRLPLPDGPGLYAAVARRHHLDHALVELARSNGVDVVEGCALTAVDVDEGGVTATFADGSRARCSRLVAADGMWSPVRRILAPDTADGYRGEWHAFRQYLTGVAPRAARELVVWFEPDVIPGYAWSFPVGDNTANVGFGLRRRGRLAGARMAALWRDLLARPRLRAVLGPDATPEGSHRAWPIPARIGRLPLTAAGGRVLFVGDAAGAADPLTGEGIGQALVTGRLAATAIAAHPPGAAGDDPAAVAAAYTRATRRHLLADDRMARALTTLLARRPIAESALHLVGATAWTRRNAARWMFEDYPRALVVTPRRWHRGMFTGPGAYAPR